MPQCLRAFTLAETLIVIGIIGVVAALTLPNLNHATGDKEKVTKVKKIYSALTEAFDRAQAIYGPVDEWFKGMSGYNEIGQSCGYACTEKTAKMFLEFLKVSKDCDTDSGCWDSASYIDKDKGYYKAILSDGTSLAFYADHCDITIYFDIDGPNKGKNQFDNDIFNVSVKFYSDLDSNYGQTYGELYPSTAADSQTGNLSDHEFNYGTAWIIKNGNMDYLKCPEDLNWETQTSCK